MINIILNEWIKLIRNRSFIYLTLFFIFSLFLIFWIGTLQNINQQNLQSSAQNQIREQWKNLDPMNPHSAAHYGSYVFKPTNILNSIDGGISDITGNVLKLEGHVQNEIVYSEASQSITISKFGKLKISLLLQYVIPLILIFLAFESIGGEKESRRLRLILFQGVTISKLIFSKSLSIWIYGLFLMLLTFIMHFIKSNEIEIIYRLLLISLSYGLYYYIITKRP